MSSLDPDAPGPERSSGAAWRWRLLDVSGAEVEVTGVGDGSSPRFLSQSEAETWVGEVWRELLDGGAESVVLLEGDREVYGPMSLRP
jgi:hypothetical protein